MKKSRARPSKRRSWGISAILVAGMVLAAVAGFIFVDRVLLAGQPAAAVSGPELKALGSSNAPVTVVVYSDFQ